MPTPQKAMTINYLKFRLGTNIPSPPPPASKRTSTMCVVPCCQLKFFGILCVAQDIVQKSDQASNNQVTYKRLKHRKITKMTSQKRPVKDTYLGLVIYKRFQ